MTCPTCGGECSHCETKKTCPVCDELATCSMLPEPQVVDQKGDRARAARSVTSTTAHRVGAACRSRHSSTVFSASSALAHVKEGIWMLGEIVVKDLSKKLPPKPGDYVTVRWMRGVAFVVDGYQKRWEPCLALIEGEDGEYEEDTGDEWVEDPSLGLVVRMVGDDARHDVAAEACTKLDEDAFCSDCGQVGCSHGRY